jgi:hypothetical protein
MIEFILLSFFFLLTFFFIDKSNQQMRILFLSLSLLTFIIPLWLSYQPTITITSEYSYNGTDFILLNKTMKTVEQEERIVKFKTNVMFIYITVVTFYLAIVIINYLVSVFF